MTKVAIAVPTGGSVKTLTFYSIVRMIKQTKHDWLLMTQTGCLIHKNREILVGRAIDEGCTHILFVDTDMSFEGDALDRLMAREKDIIGVASHLKKLPLTYVLRNEDRNGNYVWEEFPNEGLLKCAGVGTGFLLINLEVFKKIPHPWFFFESNDKGDLVCGEDMWFCELARKAGYEIWVDRNVEIKHIGDYLY